MATATLSALIDAPIERLRTTLLDAPLLPEWNPAFVGVTGPPLAALGTKYQLETVHGLRGDLTYTRVDAEAITMHWKVPLLAETGTWFLVPRSPEQTRVTHVVERHRMLGTLLGGALHTLPTLRLERLAERTTPSAHRGRRQGDAR